MSPKLTAEITFVVTDAATGGPVEGAQAALFVTPVDERDSYLVLGRSTAEGVCTLHPPLATDEPVRLIPIVRARGFREWRKIYDEASKAESQGRRAKWPEVSAGGSIRFSVELARGMTISGRVADQNDGPVAGARVDLVLSGNNWYSWPHSFGIGTSASWPPECLTDTEGRFEWLSVPVERAEESPGAHLVLTVSHDDFAPLLVEAIEHLEPDDDRIVHLDLQMESGRQLHGTLLRPDGTPCEGGLIKVVSTQRNSLPKDLRFAKETHSDPDGTFVLSGLQHEKYLMEVEAEGLCPTRTEMELNASTSGDITVKLAPGSSLHGAVHDASGAPVAREQVHLAAANHYYRSTRTLPDGRFAFPSLPATGRATVRCAGRFEKTVELPSRPLSIRLSEPVKLSIRLVSKEDGSALGPPGTVYVHGPSGTLELDVGEDGMTSPVAVPPGKYALYVDLPGMAASRSEVTVTDKGPTDAVVVSVQRGAAMTGVARDADGNALAGVRVRAWGAGRHNKRETETNAEGRYRLEGLLGRSTVAFTLDGFAVYAVWAVDMADTRDGPVVLDAVMRSGATVRGVVRSHEGVPLEDVTVRVLDRQRNLIPYELPSTATDANGAYELCCVPEGVVIIAAGRHVAEVDLADGQEFVMDF
jgi:protocatechuate 3,4-dioxygenase beta subunit